MKSNRHENSRQDDGQQLATFLFAPKPAQDDSTLPRDIERTLSEWSGWYDKLQTSLYGENANDYEEQESFNKYTRLRHYFQFSGGYEHLVSNGIEDLDDETIANVCRFVAYDLWFHFNQMKLSSVGIQGSNETITKEYEQSKESVFPVIYRIVEHLSRVDNTTNLELLFEGLTNTDNYSVIKDLLTHKELTDTQRMSVAVAAINKFGYIRVIDTVAQESNATNLSDGLRNELKALYSDLQGDEVTTIYESLSEIYKRINFGEYAVNTSELTTFEVELLTSHLPSNHVPQDTRLVDLGAGTGRHTVPLSKKGYHVTSVEPEKHHCEAIKSKAPNAIVVNSGWDNLIGKNVVEPHSIDMTFVLGRSATHNRTPEAMLKMTDAVSVITKSSGLFIIDFADVNFGIYRERITHLRDNLGKKGINVEKRGILFDGPNDLEKFNRLVLSHDQLDALATLFGFRLHEVVERKQGKNDEINNLYYVLQKDETVMKKLSHDMLLDKLHVLDLLHIETDFDMYLETWGMTLGQAIAFVDQYGLSSNKLRELNKAGNGPKVRVSSHEGKLLFNGA